MCVDINKCDQMSIYIQMHLRLHLKCVLCYVLINEIKICEILMKYFEISFNFAGRQPCKSSSARTCFSGPFQYDNRFLEKADY